MDEGAWWAAVHGVAKSRTRLSDFSFTFHFHALEKEMATHSSVLAWRIPGTGEPGGLPSMGSHRVRHNWRDLAAAAAGSGKVLNTFKAGCAKLWCQPFRSVKCTFSIFNSWRVYRDINCRRSVLCFSLDIHNCDKVQYQLGTVGA